MVTMDNVSFVDLVLLVFGQLCDDDYYSEEKVEAEDEEEE